MGHGHDREFVSKLFFRTFPGESLAGKDYFAINGEGRQVITATLSLHSRDCPHRGVSMGL